MSEQWVDSAANRELAGFWDEEGTITFVPLNYVKFPSKKFKNKMSVFIVAELVEPSDNLTNKDGEALEAVAGETIGIWYSPGKSALTSLAGVKVRMRRDPELDKEVGQPQLMKGYRIQHPKGAKGGKLELAPRFMGLDTTPEPERSESENTDDLPF